jgi:hypothetical protein
MEPFMNSWTNNYYHNSTGKILGSIVLYGDKYKAMIDSMFIGWFISEEHAKVAVESAYADGFTPAIVDRSIKAQYTGAKYATN